MALVVVYALLPLFWLFVNATKTQPDLFCSFGLWFGDDFALFDNIAQTLTYNDGIFVRWLGNTLLYVVSAPAARPCWPPLAGYGLAKFDFPGQARGVRRRPRRDRHPRHRARRADLPHVQPARPDQHPVGGHHPVAHQPLRPLPDLDLCASTRFPPSCSRPPGSTAPASSAPSSPSPCRLLAPGIVTVLLFTVVATWNNYFLPLIMLSDPTWYPLTVGPQPVERPGDQARRRSRSTTS